VTIRSSESIIGRRRMNTGLTKILGKMLDGNLSTNSTFEHIADDIITQPPTQ